VVVTYDLISGRLPILQVLIAAEQATLMLEPIRVEMKECRIVSGGCTEISVTPGMITV